MDIAQILMLLFALVSAIGVLVQMRLHALQIRREELEIRKLEEESAKPGDERTVN